MCAIAVDKCLCDVTRLRILNLLGKGPLCVCHLQVILQEPQVKVSKHLSYLKKHGLIECERKANWNIYSLSGQPSSILAQNWKCLQELVTEEPVFRADLRRLEKTDVSAGRLPTEMSESCCPGQTSPPS